MISTNRNKQANEFLTLLESYKKHSKLDIWGRTEEGGRYALRI